MKYAISSRPVVLAGIILLAALSRLLPHPPNVTPILAMCLFGGAYFTEKRWAFAVPLLAMIVSDLALSLLSGYALLTPMRAVVYGCLLGVVALGTGLLRRITTLRVAAGALSGAVGFFLVTNFAVWAGGTLYPMTWAGLVECYVAAIPFFRNTLIGTLGYSTALFGIFEMAKLRFPVLATT